MDIQVFGIVKDYGATPALRDVSLDIRSGELMALLGPSGSGKTTLLRVIAGLETPAAGRILFGEQDTTHLPVRARGVGFVFQHYALFRHMNVRDNISYSLRIQPRSTRPSAGAIAERVRELLRLIQLDGYEERFPAQLSGGQRQRVALARALAVDPKVLLLDEPFGALDAKVRREMRRWLREIHERTGQTTIFVTHDQDEALELADRVAILNQGRIEQAGTPDDICERPASPFVMAFVGETTCLRVQVHAGQVYHGGSRLALSCPELNDGEADLYVRPWEASIARPDGVLPTARIQTVRRSGGAHRIELRILTSGAALTVEVPGPFDDRAGDKVGLRISAGRLFTLRGVDRPQAVSSMPSACW